MSNGAIVFWIALGVATIWWPDWYCSVKRVKTFTESELAVLSPAFANINRAHNIWSVIWGLGVGLSGVVWFMILQGDQGPFQFETPAVQVIPWIAFVLAGGAMFFPLFAYRKGVYPIPKSYRYLYQPPELVRRIGRFQIAFALTVMFIAAIVSILS